MANMKYTPELMKEALIKAKGIKSAASQILGCSRQTLDNYIEKHPEIADVEHEITEQMIDVAEVELYKNIKKGHASSIFFYLKTKGKNRGYTERTEITGEGGTAIIPVVNVSIKSDDAKVNLSVEDAETKSD